jgi:hypothetical protein
LSPFFDFNNLPTEKIAYLMEKTGMLKKQKTTYKNPNNKKSPEPQIRRKTITASSVMSTLKNLETINKNFFANLNEKSDESSKK